MLYEINPLLTVDENGIVISEGASAAWMARLDEWLRTPQGSVYGLPWWGNPMEKFKHEPIGSGESDVLEVDIECQLLNKIRQDLPGLNLHSVRCKAIDVDLLNISFMSQQGDLTVNLRNTKGDA